MKEHAKSTSRKAGTGAKRTHKVASGKPRNQKNRTRGSHPTASSAAKKKNAPVANNDALTKKIAGIRQLLIEADTQDVAARYKIAVECRAIIAGDGKGKVYGAGAARKLGKEFGWSKTALYADVAVAATWNEEKFRKLADKHDKFGKLLSWSHYVTLAAEKDPQRRRELTKQTLDNGWSVRDLKKALSGTQQDGNEATGTREPEPPRPLTAAIANYATGFRTAKDNADMFGQAISTQVESAEPSVLKSGLLEQLKKARADLEVHYQTESQRLDALIKKIEAGDSALPKSAADAEVNTRRLEATRE